MVSLFISVFLIFAQAREGFFTKDQIQLPFDIRAIEKSALLIEENQGPGSWKHIGNGLFVTASGHILTNYHVAHSCVRANKDFFKEKYGSIHNLNRQGFYSDDPEGLPCRILRGTDDPKSGTVYQLSLISLPPIPEPKAASNAQDSQGPFFDFAILKVTSVKKDQSFTALKIQKKNSTSAQIDDPVYLLGYPALTARGQDSQLIKDGAYQDVVTGDFRISEGRILSMKPEYYYHPKQHSYFYTDTDGGQGTSGSALVNKEGLLIALVLGSGDDKNTASASHCVMKFTYCGGVSLYLKTEVIVETISASFPDLSLILF